MEVKRFVFNPFEENTYVLYDSSGECIIIDAGCYEKEEQRELINFIEDNQLQVKKLVNTHCHIDHVLGIAAMKDYFKVELFLHPIEEQVLRAVKAYAPNWGFHNYQEATPDKYIDEGDTIEFGAQSLKIFFVPGHSPGHLAFYNEQAKMLIAGDVLFENSIGRTDLPGGDFETLIDSIHKKLFKLPDEVTVHCGHGRQTSIGVEKRTNPFCAIPG